jgi:xanthosine utilization system XapX-like protein
MTMLLFVLLQGGDLATTLAFLQGGVAEANPLVALALRLPAPPVVGLALVKLAGCGLGWFAWQSGRRKLLRRANVFFALCVVWNLVSLTRIAAA